MPAKGVSKSMMLPHVRRRSNGSWFFQWSSWTWSLALLPFLLHDFVVAGRLWKTLHMDSSELTVSSGDSDCDVIRPIRNDDMSEGDFYAVKSDSWHGKPHMNRRPSECTMAFNLGDRLVSVVVKDWWCSQPDSEPSLAVYDNCEGKRMGLLTILNCSSPVPLEAIQSSTYCMTLYHYRGHVKSGYFFSLYVVANHEVFAFPAGGIAAIIISIIVFVMLVVKIVCVISGYERRLPEMKLDDDDQKQILTSPSGDNVLEPETSGRSNRLLPEQLHPNFDVTSSVSLEDGGGSHLPPASNSRPSNDNSILRYSRSPRSSYCYHGTNPFAGGGRAGGIGGDNDLVTSTLDPDYECCLGVSIDDPRSPTLKANPYTSPIASPLWRH